MAERIVGRDAALAEVARARAANEGPNLRVADLRGASLRGANLHVADLRGADLIGADLCGASLYGADLGGGNLRGANLYWANLYWASLHGADLGGADLRGANLSGANLGGANLRGANLSGANLGGVDLPDGWTVRSWTGAGSARRMTTLAVYPGGHTVWCGGFTGTVDEFAAAVETTHGANPLHLEDYREIVASMRRILAREVSP